MQEIVWREAVYLWYFFDLQFRQIFPYWLAGIFAGSLVSVFVKKHIHALMSRLQNRSWGILGIAIASLLGIASPLCMYGTVPVAASFSRSGMREDWISSFMMSSILLNPQLFLYSFALGKNLAFARFFAAFFGGCAAGVLIRLFYKDKSFYTFASFDLPESRDTDYNIFIRLLKNIWRNIRVTFPYFFAGVAITALYQRYIPAGWIADLFGKSKGFATLMAAALGVPLYTCGGGTIPLIVAWLSEGMSSGSAIAFMIAGPATKLTNLGAVKTILGTKHFVLYMAFSILFAALIGAVINIYW